MFKMYIFYLSNGTIQPLFGRTPEEALSNGGFDLRWIIENVRDFREQHQDPLIFTNGKWVQSNSSLSEKETLTGAQILP